jgi:hypothetical protein
MTGVSRPDKDRREGKARKPLSFDPDYLYARAIHSPDGRLCYEGFTFAERKETHVKSGRWFHYTVTHDDLLPVGGTFLLFEMEQRAFPPAVCEG